MSASKFRFAFVGDVSLASPYRAQAGVLNFRDWSTMTETIGEHDYLVGNLECCLVDDRCNAAARKQVMAVPAGAASFLRATGFTDLCLANNHVPDSGPEAIEVTRERLTADGIRVFGAGKDLNEAETTVFSKHDGHTIAFLGACDYSEYFAKSSGGAGVAPLRQKRLRHRVRAAATQADLVVVTLHADLEFSEVPGRWRQRLAHSLIRHGAHLVIQHHPHVLQGIEMYRGSLIAYSLGNFIFGLRGNRYQEHEPGVFDSMILVVDADLSTVRPKLSYSVIPARIGSDHFPVELTGTARECALQRVQYLSDLVADGASHRRMWLARCRKEAAERFCRIYYALGRTNFKLAAQESWRLFARPEDRRWIIGLLSFGYF